MSVFTHLHDDTIANLLAPLGLTLIEATAATHGIENSNYLLRCQRADGSPVGRVLTVFEQRPASTLPWFAALLAQLQQHGLPVAAPIALDGKAVLDIAGKKAFLVPWLPGEHVFTVSAQHCQAIGALLAQLHQCPLPPPNSGHPADSERQLLATLAAEQLPHLPPAERNAAQQVLDAWQHAQGTRCLVHADLFRDNVLFHNVSFHEAASLASSTSEPSGLLDLYNACEELPAYDLAVALNDWCVHADGTFDPPRYSALFEGYCDGVSAQPASAAAAPTEQRLAVLPLALAVAALRFYLSRRVSQQQALDNPQATGMVSKDPEPFRQMFLLRYQDWLGGRMR